MKHLLRSTRGLSLLASLPHQINKLQPIGHGPARTRRASSRGTHRCVEAVRYGAKFPRQEAAREDLCFRALELALEQAHELVVPRRVLAVRRRQPSDLKCTTAIHQSAHPQNAIAQSETHRAAGLLDVHAREAHHLRGGGAPERARERDHRVRGVLLREIGRAHV